MLEMQGISKSFGATCALKKVELQACRGQVVAIIGENGAGKSTLMKILSGAHQPDEGVMMLDGHPYRPQNPMEGRRAGIAMIYQELNLAPDLSVCDNVMLGLEAQRWGWLDRRKQREIVRNALQRLGHGELDLNRTVGSFSLGMQQLIEIARGIASQAKVIILDEPTSSLPQVDAQRLFAIMEQLKAQGLGILYISHFLEEIRQVADRYVVLNDGRTVGAGELSHISNEQIVTLMVGRTVRELFPRVEHAIGEPILKLEKVSGNPLPLDVSLELRRGEIFGLFGLIGAGRTELLRALFGLDAIRSGSIQLVQGHGGWKSVHHHHGVSVGMGLVSEDRKREGLAQSQSIADNMTLSRLQPYATWGWLRERARQDSVRDWMQRLKIKAQSGDQEVSQLSGGNQQKVAIARVLHQDAEILLLDEPTRGIDVGTKAEIYQWIGHLAAQGKSIVFVSSYLPELMAVCDRLGVMARGRLLEVRDIEGWSEHEVLSRAISMVA